MKITILNGNMNPQPDVFSNYIENLVAYFDANHNINLFNLNQMDLRYCTGCWNCWWKTPGLCIHQDDGATIFSAVINADVVLFASPIMAGFTTSALKKITDRLIVLLHPYFDIINGETHHKKRYNHYPRFGVLLEKEKDTDAEDLKIISDLYERFAFNFHSEISFVKFIETSTIEEVANGTCNL
jgi:multimeric flavodoxin WrbA